jgi:hypothetical protein
MRAAILAANLGPEPFSPSLAAGARLERARRDIERAERFLPTHHPKATLPGVERDRSGAWLRRG